jgi:hypothetical protein
LRANPKLRYYLEAAFESKRNNSHIFAGKDTSYEKQICNQVLKAVKKTNKIETKVADILHETTQTKHIFHTLDLHSLYAWHVSCITRNVQRICCIAQIEKSGQR